MNNKTLKGSCLCGQVSYTVTGDPKKFYHCHCSRCQKASGTGHASNVLMTAGGIDWSGEDSLRKSFKVPDAERFTTHFCTNCGSGLPRHMPTMNRVVIPAGSLDTDPGIAPQARIFSGSKAPWSCGPDQKLPLFEQYPT